MKKSEKRTSELFPFSAAPKSLRFKDPFLDLDEYKKAPEIKISSCNIGNFYANPTLFNGTHPQHGLRGISGRYFELVARAIYSGTIRTTHELKQGETTVTCEPDITHNTPLKREVKSVCTGEWLKLSDEQVAKYCIIQARKLGCESRGGYSLLPFKEDIYPLLTYEIFRHCLRKMNEKCRNKTHHDLISMLTKSGRFLISLPFSILYQIHTIQKRGYTSRYD